MGRSISPMAEEPVAGSDPTAAPRLIVPMSLQLVIPRRVALQQSSPPLHQLSVILKEKRKFEKKKPLNGKCANTKLSQPRGSPQVDAAKVCRIAQYPLSACATMAGQIGNRLETKLGVLP